MTQHYVVSHVETLTGWNGEQQVRLDLVPRTGPGDAPEQAHIYVSGLNSLGNAQVGWPVTITATLPTAAPAPAAKP